MAPGSKVNPKYKLSPSSLSLMEDCQRCFWLQVVKGVKRPSGVFPSLPSGIDGVLKRHFDRYRAKGELPPELAAHQVDARLFADRALLDVWRSNLKGIQWLDQESNIMLRGAVDDILEKDGTLIVLDFKTRGFPLKEDTAEFYHNQINIYNMLLRKNGRKTADYGYLLFFHPLEVGKDGSFVFKTDLATIRISVAGAEKLFRKAVQVLSGAMPDAAESCEFCRWGRDLGSL